MTSSLKKRKSSKSLENSKEKQAKIEKSDFFELFWKKEVNDIGSEQLKDLKNRSKNAQKLNISGIGDVLYYKGLGNLELPTEASPSNSGNWSENLWKNVEKELENEDFVPEDGEYQKSAQEIIGKYMDFLSIRENVGEYRTLYAAQILSHLIKNKNLIIGNKRKLELHSATGDCPEELIESCRDSGFVRPTVLVLCPFKKDAYDFVHRLSRLIYGDGKKEIWSIQKFEKEYSGSEEAPDSRVDFPDDHLELLKGNNDDSFRIGIALSKKVLKLYENFEKADILLCSPLGLRMMLNGEEGDVSHLLSSINITVLDRLDILLQQNWENLQVIFEHLHGQPTKIEVDISRVRKLYLDGHSKHYSQLLMFSKYSHELFTSLAVQNSANHNGLVISKPKEEGTLLKIEIPLCQEIHKFEVKDPTDISTSRFKYFIEKIVVGLTPRTCIVIPSYFDFVRIRNHFKRLDESFVTCHEYAPRAKIDRAKDMFYHQRKSYILVTERWYFFNRRQIPGIHRIVFFQLPSHPLFYSEFINMSEAETNQRFLANVLICKFDKLRMENVFGTEMATSILNKKQNVQAIISE